MSSEAETSGYERKVVHILDQISPLQSASGRLPVEMTRGADFDLRDALHKLLHLWDFQVRTGNFTRLTGIQMGL